MPKRKEPEKIMLKHWIEKALTKKVAVHVDYARTGKHPKRARRIETIEIPPSQKLLYGVYFMTILLAALTAIEIVHVIFLGSFNNEIFHLMNTLVSVMVGVFFGAKI